MLYELFYFKGIDFKSTGLYVQVMGTKFESFSHDFLSVYALIRSSLAEWSTPYQQSWVGASGLSAYDDTQAPSYCGIQPGGVSNDYSSMCNYNLENNMNSQWGNGYNFYAGPPSFTDPPDQVSSTENASSTGATQQSSGTASVMV